jgi:hypothetical protein
VFGSIAHSRSPASKPRDVRVHVVHQPRHVRAGYERHLLVGGERSRPLRSYAGAVRKLFAVNKSGSSLGS